jgi:hypothetical protein
LQKVAGRARDTYGVFVRRAADGSAYVLAVNEDGNFALVRLTPTALEPLTRGRVAVNREAKNTIRLTATGRTLRAAVNGEMAGEAEDARQPLGIGSFGVFADPTVEVVATRFVATAQPGATSTADPSAPDAAVTLGVLLFPTGICVAGLALLVVGLLPRSARQALPSDRRMPLVP